MVVRARRREWITELRARHMPELSEPQHFPQADYQWHAFIRPGDLARGMAAIAESVTYGNYKSAIEDDNLHWAAHRVWATLLAAGDGTSAYDARRPRKARASA
jgi:hypothetical protein